MGRCSQVHLTKVVTGRKEAEHARQARQKARHTTNVNASLNRKRRSATEKRKAEELRANSNIRRPGAGVNAGHNIQPEQGYQCSQVQRENILALMGVGARRKWAQPKRCVVVGAAEFVLMVGRCAQVMRQTGRHVSLFYMAARRLVCIGVVVIATMLIVV